MHVSNHSAPTTTKPAQCLKVPGQSQAGSIFGKVDLSKEWVWYSFYSTSSSTRLSAPRALAILNTCKAPTPLCSWPLPPPFILLLKTIFSLDRWGSPCHCALTGVRTPEEVNLYTPLLFNLGGALLFKCGCQKP